jgi:hypothetical protein
MTVDSSKATRDSVLSESRRSTRGTGNLLWLIFLSLFCTHTALAQSQQSASGSDPLPTLPESVQQTPGSISGTVTDPSGAAIVGAHITLTRANAPRSQEILAGDDGQFFFANVPPGPFQLTVSAEGFTTQAFPGTLHPGEVYIAQHIALPLAGENTVLKVSLTQDEVAETQIKLEEQQRVLGFIPNFYVSYIPDAAPLNKRQKFELAWKTTIDPVNFVLTGATAGAEQAFNAFGGYGQGAQGYAKRYGAAYADGFTGTFIAGAILPALLKQDPRYFYKGTGSTRARLFYAMANAVICKGDNKRWQPNYSSILGSLASGGISNLYYPPSDRNGAELTFVNAGIGIGADAAANIVQEFIVKKITPKVANRDPDPASP